MRPVALEHDCSLAIRTKAAVSIRDEAFNAAEHAASVMGMPRSQLYARAVEEFVSRQFRERVTERLDAVNGGAESSSSLDSRLEHLRFQSLPNDGKW